MKQTFHQRSLRPNVINLGALSLFIHNSTFAPFTLNTFADFGALGEKKLDSNELKCLMVFSKYGVRIKTV